ncbi:MAG TPA: dihydroxyacetone kinase subunit DhaL [Anaerolineae bacterium]
MTDLLITSTDIFRWMTGFAKSINENRQRLTELDAAIGDGDHGVNMDRGLTAVVPKLMAIDGDISLLMKTTGMTLLSTVGGASGPLYGTFFLHAAQTCARKERLNLDDWIALLDAGMSGVMTRGKAVAGDKTMLDALAPAIDALRDSSTTHLSFEQALHASTVAAERGLQSTFSMIAKKGRASYLGERSIGHLDPGAASMALLIAAAEAAFCGA